jgi:hypothetical protein
MRLLELPSVRKKESGAMRRLIVWALAGMALIAVSAGASAAMIPTVRHIVSGWWHDPASMAALSENPQIHYEPGALEYARAVAELLPAAIAQVETAQGRPFAHPVTIGVYVTSEAFAAANGTGFAGAVGVMFLGTVNLSPRLFSVQRQRLHAILTHELSHAHIRSWISELTYIRLPNWFKEGLAVAVSQGGGAEMVSEMQAMAAIQRGDHIAIAGSGSLFEISGVKFEYEQPYSAFRFELAYRQAGIFVSYLRDTNAPGFARMINAILDGRQFEEAVAAAYQENLQSLWLRFMQTGAKSR